MRAAATGHTFLSVTKQGLSAIVETEGNPYTHVILRGSSKGPNYAAEHVKACAEKLQKSGLAPRLMIDCSHGNSSKQHVKQMEVGKSIREQLEGSETAANIMGVMIESNLAEGKQSVPVEGPSGLKYGVSITDACLAWEGQTVSLLDDLRAGVRARRANIKAAREQ
ncbi:hypothetical protein QFC22_001512 [Naganishia vaughanmartiniae]|uniref:Uncharacterized protein n=1 Tax=Naganishia vaughanmartiniae TaxID=1424756 RepID=A0ACC2XHK3_9TREE|nr:hypothetical protein QFC22_001512 [Naganishia vaughanmartiniae]